MTQSMTCPHCEKMRGGTLRVQQLDDLNTGALVRAKRIPRAIGIAFAIVFLEIAGWIVWAAAMAP